MNGAPAHFVYATRSVIPSRFANTVQSANMACAFSEVYPAFSTIFRSPSTCTDDLPAVFASFELTPPRNPHLVRATPALDWAQTYLAAFAAYFRRQPPGTLVYTRSGRVAWAASLAGLKTVIELHDPLIAPYAAWLQRQARLQPSLKLVATTSRLKSDLIAQVGLAPDQIFVAGGGANSALLKLPARPLDSPYAFNAAYAGSAFKGKGLEIVTACAARLADVGFHVIGPTSEECQRFGPVGPNVIIHGRQDNRTTLGLLKSADCLLLPNQPSVIIRSGADIGHYTSPLKMFEYMAAGRPIIASDLPVLSGTLHHERNALLCPAEVADAFSASIRRLQSEPELGRRLAAEAMHNFATAYTWNARAARIREFIEG